MNILNNAYKTIAIFLSLSVSSCNYFPCGWDDDLNKVSVIPEEQTLIGQYIPDEITKEIIPGYKTTSAKIILERGGSMKIQNVPGSTFDFEKRYRNRHEPVSATGQWQLDKKDKQVELDVRMNFQPNTKGTYGTSYGLYKKKGKYVIFIIVGDPDECAAARFIQK